MPFSSALYVKVTAEPSTVAAEAAIRAEGAELERRAGGLSPFLAAFFGGRKLTPAEAEELKELIDRTTWEG